MRSRDKLAALDINRLYGLQLTKLYNTWHTMLELTVGELV
jgi:hypothetical protein